MNYAEPFRSRDDEDVFQDGGITALKREVTVRDREGRDLTWKSFMIFLLRFMATGEEGHCCIS